MRVLLVRPPKYLWPYMNEQDNYLLPQAIVYLGAEARRRGQRSQGSPRRGSAA